MLYEASCSCGLLKKTSVFLCELILWICQTWTVLARRLAWKARLPQRQGRKRNPGVVLPRDNNWQGKRKYRNPEQQATILKMAGTVNA
jgi:hypothetical protein